MLYSTVQNQKFPGLVRTLTLTNAASSSSGDEESRNVLEVDMLDGLAKLVPSGLGFEATNVSAANCWSFSVMPGCALTFAIVIFPFECIEYGQNSRGVDASVQCRRC